MNKKIIGQSFWFCEECDAPHVLEVEIPDAKDDPFVTLGGIHVHAFGQRIDLPSIPVRISFNDRLRIFRSCR